MPTFKFEGLKIEDALKNAVPKCPKCDKRLDRIPVIGTPRFTPVFLPLTTNTPYHQLLDLRISSDIIGLCATLCTTVHRSAPLPNNRQIFWRRERAE